MKWLYMEKEDKQGNVIVTRTLRQQSQERSSLLIAQERTEALKGMDTIEDLYGLTIRRATPGDLQENVSSDFGSSTVQDSSSNHIKHRLLRGLKANQLNQEGIDEN